MKKITGSILITILAVSCLSTLIVPTIAQTTEPQEETQPTPPPLVVRWMRFRGAVTNWGDEQYHGTVVVNARTANAPISVFKPWASVKAAWSNEERPIASPTKPVGEVTYTHYIANLVVFQGIKGKLADPAYNLQVIGLWNVNKVVITSEFDQDGKLVKLTREITPIAKLAKGELHISDDWKKFDIQITDLEPIEGKGIGMFTTTNKINPFSFNESPKPTLADLKQIVKSYRAIPGFGNFQHELDYNSNSKIDLSDLTTVAANM